MRGEQNARLAAGPDLRSLEVKPTFQFSAAIVPMATSAPLLGKQGKAAHSKASIFYGADEYLEELFFLFLFFCFLFKKTKNKKKQKQNKILRSLRRSTSTTTKLLR